MDTGRMQERNTLDAIVSPRSVVVQLFTKDSISFAYRNPSRSCPMLSRLRGGRILCVRVVGLELDTTQFCFPPSNGRIESFHWRIRFVTHQYSCEDFSGL